MSIFPMSLTNMARFFGLVSQFKSYNVIKCNLLIVFDWYMSGGTRRPTCFRMQSTANGLWIWHRLGRLEGMAQWNDDSTGFAFRTINIMPTNYRNTFCVFKSFNGRRRGYAGTHLRYRLQDVTILLISYLFTTFQLSYIVCFSENGTAPRCR